MYFCEDCQKEFEYVKIVTLAGPDGAIRKLLCPFCESRSFTEKKGGYCRLCGTKLPLYGREYCSESCRKTGIRLWAKQEDGKEHPNAVSRSLNEVEEYNIRTGNRLSYGQYFALKGARMI